MGRKKALIVFLIVLILQVVLYVFLYMRTNWITPPGHMHLISEEIAYYIAVIRQSMLGEWTHTYPYTTLFTPKIYNYLFFIGAGKIAALFHIDPVIMYEITKVTGGIALLTTTYMLITLLLPAAIQIPAILFTMVFETGPLWADLVNKQIKTIWFLDPMLYRHFYLAHHTWGEAFGLALLYVIFRAIHKPSRFVPLFIIVLSVASTLTSPTFAVILVPCFFIPWLLYTIATKTFKRSFLPITLTIAGIGAAGIFMKIQLSADPSWNTAAAVEKTWWSTDYILQPFLASYSLFYPFVALLLLLIPFSWKNWSGSMRRTFILFFCLSVLPIGLIYIAAFPWFPVSNGRIATDLSAVPIGILSSLVFYAAGQMKWLRLPLKRFISGLFLVIIIVSISLSAVYFKQIMDDQDDTVFNKGSSWVEYSTVNLWNGIMALKDVPIWSHIMVNPRVAPVLPVYFPVYVYQGPTALGESSGWFVRRGLSYIFYTGEMPREDLRKLFTENKISYVFHGPEEKAALKTPTFYPDVLEVMYQNPDVTIYKVRTGAL